MAEGKPSKTAMANLLTIPEEVIYGYVLPYLCRNDLLRFRRSCKQLKLNCDDYLQNHCKIDQEIEINESNFTFDDFLSMGITFHRIFLCNTDQLFENPRIPEFLEKFAGEITHLRVANFYACIPEKDDNFYLALTNLQHLELDYIDAFDTRCFAGEGEQVPHAPGYFPVTFKNIKTLKLGDLLMPDEGDQSYAWDLLKFCTEVEHFQHPLNSDEDTGCLYPQQPDFSKSPFDPFMDILTERLKQQPNETLKLKVYDIGFVRDDNFTGFSFTNLVELCHKQNIKLLNVHGPLLEQVGNVFENNEEFAGPIVSVKNTHGNMFGTDFPNLEQVVITSTKGSSFDITFEDERELADWPKLEILDVTIDSEYTHDAEDFFQEKTAELLNFLFCQVYRLGLKDLRIRFNNDFLGRNVTLPVPRAVDIVENCQNVAKLTLTNWLGTNKALSILWEGLFFLEEVTLEGCKKLGNVAFVGTEKDDPIFLKLKRLKVLTLTGLEEMPKLTDLAFDLVFRHLKIKQFYLGSRFPIKSFTIKGIRSLLTGEFNNSVVKFPFHGWSLANVSKKEFKQLKSEFRATHML